MILDGIDAINDQADNEALFELLRSWCFENSGIQSRHAGTILLSSRDRPAPILEYHKEAAPGVIEFFNLESLSHRESSMIIVQRQQFGTIGEDQIGNEIQMSADRIIQQLDGRQLPLQLVSSVVQVSNQLPTAEVLDELSNALANEAPANEIRSQVKIILEFLRGKFHHTQYFALKDVAPDLVLQLLDVASCAIRFIDDDDIGFMAKRLSTKYFRAKSKRTAILENDLRNAAEMLVDIGLFRKDKERRYYFVHEDVKEFFASKFPNQADVHWKWFKWIRCRQQDSAPGTWNQITRNLHGVQHGVLAIGDSGDEKRLDKVFMHYRERIARDDPKTRPSALVKEFSASTLEIDLLQNFFENRDLNQSVKKLSRNHRSDLLSAAGRALLMKGKPGHATTLFCRATSELLPPKTEDCRFHINLAADYRNISRCYYRMGRCKEARKYAKIALDMIDKMDCSGDQLVEIAERSLLVSKCDHARILGLANSRCDKVGNEYANVEHDRLFNAPDGVDDERKSWFFVWQARKLGSELLQAIWDAENISQVEEDVVKFRSGMVERHKQIMNIFNSYSEKRRIGNAEYAMLRIASAYICRSACWMEGILMRKHRIPQDGQKNISAWETEMSECARTGETEAKASGHFFVQARGTLERIRCRVMSLVIHNETLQNPKSHLLLEDCKEIDEIRAELQSLSTRLRKFGYRTLTWSVDSVRGILVVLSSYEVKKGNHWHEWKKWRNSTIVGKNCGFSWGYEDLYTVTRCLKPDWVNR